MIIEFLNTVGDSIVAFQTGSIVKIHVHTLTPYKVLEHCQKFGEYLTVKIENMTLQHNEAHGKAEEEVAVSEELDENESGVFDFTHYETTGYVHFRQKK